MKRNEGRDRPALFALIGVAVIFSYVVGQGWANLFSDMGPKTSWAAGVVIALIGLALAWAVASEWVYRPNSRQVALTYFFIILSLSALGTLNFMFSKFEGRNVILSEIDTAITSVVKLRDLGSQNIDTTEFDRFEAEVDSLINDLAREISNPANCGQGPRALAILVDLKKELPGFQALSLGGDCKNYDNRKRVDELIESYRSKAEEGKLKSQAYLKKSAEIRSKRKIAKNTEVLEEKLKALLRGFSDGGKSIKDVQTEFSQIAQDYSAIRQELALHSNGKDSSVPAKIDTSTVTALTNIGQVIPFLIGRLNHISTYFYLLIAILIDLAIVIAFWRVISSGDSGGGTKRMPKLL